MSKPTPEKTTTVFDDTKVALEVFLPATHATEDLPVTRATSARKFLTEAIDQLIEEEDKSVLRDVEEALAANPLVHHALAVWDAFETSEGAPMYIYNTNGRTPVEAVSEIVEFTGNEFNQIALNTELNPVANDSNPDAEPFHPTAPLGELITKYGKRGISVNVVSGLKDESYEDMMKWLDKDGFSLLSSNPGLDALSVVAGEVYHLEFDPNNKLHHSPVGAMLGRQLFNDLYYGVGEPLAGLRPDENGAKGGLKNLAISPQSGKTTPFDYDQRMQLIKRGVITLYAYNGVPCIVGGNRSLEDGNGIYIFRSTTRLRQVVSSVFHKCVEINVLNAGKREAGPLEKAADEMNRFLTELKSQGWLRAGVVTVDYESMKVRIKVYFEPVAPIDEVEIEFSDEPYEDEA